MDSCVGIHPTIAEDCVGLKETKEENPDASKGGCWGWSQAAECNLALECLCHSNDFKIVSVAQKLENNTMILAKLWRFFVKLLGEA